MTQPNPFVFRTILSVCLILAGGLVNADEDPPSQAELSPAHIEKLVAQLDAEEFEDRESATRQLLAGGAAVVPAMETGAESDNLEIATRCIDILKGLYEGKDVDAQADAAIALKRLCESSKGGLPDGRLPSSIRRRPEIPIFRRAACLRGCASICEDFRQGAPAVRSASPIITA